MSDIKQGFRFKPSRRFVVDGDSHLEDSDSASDEEQVSRTANLTWCVCGQCGLMPTTVESICCREKDVFGPKMAKEPDCKCVARLDSFRKACLDPVVLEILMAAMKEVVGEDLRDPISNRLYRYTSYRSFTWWVYGKLGKKVRKVIPACAVQAIRNRFPEENGIYEGFHAAINGDEMPWADDGLL